MISGCHRGGHGARPMVAAADIAADRYGNTYQSGDREISHGRTGKLPPLLVVADTPRFAYLTT
ncbi:hypothetical protein I552_9682 [Mycobacterium xenopi 3993]|nr:hypothetical protein I552_9682 [Mycobacterium xenopi 3993]